MAAGSGPSPAPADKQAAAPADELGAPASSVGLRPATLVAPDATVADAARAMRDAGMGAILVDSPSPGIVTDRDLRNRVLAEERPPSTPVRSIMSHPVKTLPADTPLHEVLHLMLAQDIHHVPLTQAGRIVGIVTDKDLLRRQAKGPLLLLERIKTLQGLEALDGYTSQLAATARSLLAGGVEPISIAHVIATLNDALTRKLLRLTEEELGQPPCPYAWLALGSEGRREQVLATDQDNALVYADDAPESHDYFAALAERVVSARLRAGFPPCPGGYMATCWRRPLAAWEDAFRQWVKTPEPQALLEAEVFLDFRRVHGELAAQPLDDVLLSGADRPLFLFHLARAALRFRPPLGLWGRVNTENGEVDLKRGGLAAIVLIARVSALAARSPVRGTPERLEAAAQAGSLSRTTAEDLADAFAFLTRLRLREQLRRLAAGDDPGNAVRLDSLSTLEQRRVREALRSVKDAQQAIALRYRAFVGQ